MRTQKLSYSLVPFFGLGLTRRAESIGTIVKLTTIEKIVA